MQLRDKSRSTFMILTILAAIGAAFATTALLSHRGSAESEPPQPQQPILVKTIGEAEQLVGHDIVEPKWVPDGYALTMVRVEDNGTDKEKRTVQVFTNPAFPQSFFWLVYDPYMDGLLDASATTVQGKPAQKNTHPPVEGRDFGILELSWSSSDDGGWVLVAPDLEPIRMDVLKEIANRMP